ncbi:hypothetical protein AVEN_22862-1 [Araneus ventricosus]|uniref:Uncharacterized protein n=1 Tax=Araneus ventricosus TaxID=182803 RepID=A0A4Y2IW46_ARAVE|nr:hypothetical protein AVEN_22862-1 [Araneus ventricosus]
MNFVDKNDERDQTEDDERDKTEDDEKDKTEDDEKDKTEDDEKDKTEDDERDKTEDDERDGNILKIIRFTIKEFNNGKPSPQKFCKIVEEAKTLLNEDSPAVEDEGKTEIEDVIGGVWIIQLIICLLRFNELPLRPLFQYLGGKSSDPSSYNRDIRRNLKKCEKLPLVAFNSIECDLPGIDTTNLSCDQKYLLDNCTAISSGVCSSDLAKRQPGTLNLALWLTTANRKIEALYINISPIK